MDEDARDRLRRRLQRYRTHHDTSVCRYDNYINNTVEQNQKQTRLLHQRWLESQNGGSRKRLKLTVVEDGNATPYVTTSSHVFNSSLHGTEASHAKSLSGTETVPTLVQADSAGIVCCTDKNDSSIQNLLEEVSPDTLIPDCGSLAVAMVVQNSLSQVSPRESCPEKSSVADSEKISIETSSSSSNTELPCDTAISCPASYCLL